jgi:hypothetical protein
MGKCRQGAQNQTEGQTLPCLRRTSYDFLMDEHENELSRLVDQLARPSPCA